MVSQPVGVRIGVSHVLVAANCECNYLLNPMSARCSTVWSPRHNRERLPLVELRPDDRGQDEVRPKPPLPADEKLIDQRKDDVP